MYGECPMIGSLLRQLLRLDRKAVASFYDCRMYFALFSTALVIPGWLTACGTDFTDCFGIQKLYADATPSANNWTFTGNARDPRFMEQHVIPAGEGWFQPMDPEEMRVEVLSDVAASEGKIPTFDLSKVLAKGFIFKPPNSPDGAGDSELW